VLHDPLHAAPAGSRWSAVNVRRAGEPIAEGRMRPAERRVEAGYSYERAAAELSPEDEARFRARGARGPTGRRLL